AKHGGAPLTVGSLTQHGAETIAVEDVVAENQADAAVTDKLLTDQERLSQSVRRGLFGITKRDTEIRTIAKQLAKVRQIVGRGNHQNLANSRQHQYRKRVIDHRFVVDGQQLLGNAPGNGMQSGTGSTGQNDAFHAFSPRRAN